MTFAAWPYSENGAYIDTFNNTLSKVNSFIKDKTLRKMLSATKCCLIGVS